MAPASTQPLTQLSTQSSKTDAKEKNYRENKDLNPCLAFGWLGQGSWLGGKDEAPNPVFDQYQKSLLRCSGLTTGVITGSAGIALQSSLIPISLTNRHNFPSDSAWKNGLSRV